MDDIFTKLRNLWRDGGILIRLIYINVGVFILIRVAALILMLFHLDGNDFLLYLQIPASFKTLLVRPWTLITYMFTHYGFLHILFNMLWLYVFGKIFLQFLNGRQLGGLYFMGGIAGGLLFMVCYNIFPYFRESMDVSYMMGASAAVMAIVFAISFYQKNYELNIILIGRIKLIYLAIFCLVLDFLAIGSDNAGGHIAHIGGALFGMLFAYLYSNGTDITRPVSRVLDWFVNLFKPRPKKAKMHVTYNKREADYEFNTRKHQEMDELDAILDKLKRSGYSSLSADEKKKLFDAGKK